MFTAKDFVIRKRVRIHSYFAGISGRKDLLREFCRRNGIDFKPRANYKYHLPKEYLIEHEEFTYLSGVRDKLILSFYDDYRNKQLDNMDQQTIVREKIDKQKDILEEDKCNLQKYRAELKKAKTAINKIHFENMIESTKTKISNERSLKTEYKNELLHLEKQYLNSTDNWHKQLIVLNNIFDLQRRSFEKNVSKKVREKLNYTDFRSQLYDYNEDVKKILKGEIYEKKEA